MSMLYCVASVSEIIGIGLVILIYDETILKFRLFLITRSSSTRSGITMVKKSGRSKTWSIEVMVLFVSFPPFCWIVDFRCCHRLNFYITYVLANSEIHSKTCQSYRNMLKFPPPPHKIIHWITMEVFHVFEPLIRFEWSNFSYANWKCHF